MLMVPLAFMFYTDFIYFYFRVRLRGGDLFQEAETVSSAETLVLKMQIYSMWLIYEGTLWT